MPMSWWCKQSGTETSWPSVHRHWIPSPIEPSKRLNGACGGVYRHENGVIQTSTTKQKTWTSQFCGEAYRSENGCDQGSQVVHVAHVEDSSATTRTSKRIFNNSKIALHLTFGPFRVFAPCGQVNKWHQISVSAICKETSHREKKVSGVA